MKIFYVLGVVFYFWLIWDDLAIANENLTPEFREFCQKYMVYVDQYPGKFHAGCCNIDHPSNNILKKGWKGESLLFCDGQEIV